MWEVWVSEWVDSAVTAAGKSSRDAQRAIKAHFYKENYKEYNRVLQRLTKILKMRKMYE